MYLSYSGYKRAVACLLSFWHVYLNKTRHGKPDDRLGSIYGSAIGVLFEKFYKERLWEQPNTRKVMEAMAPAVVDKLLKDAVKADKIHHAGVILWRGEDEGQNPKGLYFDQEELTRNVIAAIGRGLRTIKENLFLSKNAQAELKLDRTVGDHYLAGRVDFLMRRVKHEDIIIIDGKGTHHTKVENGVRRGTYLEEDQLTWYSLLFREHYRRLPDRTAYLLWYYEPPTNVTWVDVNLEGVMELRDSVLSTADRLLEKRTTLYGDELTEAQLAKGEAGPPRSLDVVREYYPPTANQQNCQFCPYATEEFCSEGYALMTKLRERWDSRKG